MRVAALRRVDARGALETKRPANPHMRCYRFTGHAAVKWVISASLNMRTLPRAADGHRPSVGLR
jgi:hypothetical protein